MNKGKAIIFCAPSGAGKTTIVKHLLEAIPSLKFSISATTRAPRSSVEVHGKDYYFLSIEDFESRRDRGLFLEWEEVYNGTYYGTLKSELDRIWSAGGHVIFDVDVVGGLNIKRQLGENALAIFVNAESVEVLEERLRKRNTDSEESLLKRLNKATQEMAFAEHFDVILINRDLNEAFRMAEDLVGNFIK